MFANEMSNKSLKAIGKRIEDKRWELGLNKGQFIKKIGVSQPTYSLLINGKGTIKIEGYIKIEKALNIDLVNDVVEVIRNK
jgi:transcriptional regulator with XRE-family HTH domain